jgi:hypothetical protein
MKPAALRACLALAVGVVVPAETLRAATSVPADPYQPLAFLVGHCWKGAFAGDSGTTDEHCFSRVYGGKFVRDEHVVHREGRPDAFGESIYTWDPGAGRLEYLYIESAGGFLRGTVVAEEGALVFPAAAFVERDGSMNVRSRWQRAGDDAYDVVTEFQVQDRWVPGFTLHMLRVQNAST